MCMTNSKLAWLLYISGAFNCSCEPQNFQVEFSSKPVEKRAITTSYSGSVI